ncbi:MAG: DPP IV N-terminal domain-containing protein [Planctomycetes bacterium]|nr:DPP IV N-terminal domain-containing protein [Planctomycetota bacterium]
MNRLAAIVFGWWALSTAAVAQPAQQELAVDTTYLRTLAQTRSFQLGRPVRPHPTPDGQAVLFLRSAPRSSKLSLFEFDVPSGKTRELLTPEQLLKGAEEKLSPEEKAARERMRVSVGGFANFQLNHDGSLILLSLSGRLYTVERSTRTVTELKTGKGFLLDPKFSPDGKKVSYVRDHDVFVLDLASQKEIRVTSGGAAPVEHGVAEFVAQEEMGRFTGYWWSPDSDRIVYQETDHADVEVWHVADPIHPGAAPTPFYYPRPGKNNAKVKLGLVPVGASKDPKTVWIDWDREKFPYLATVRWVKNAPLCLTVQSRDQRELVLLQADIRSGATKTLLTETSTTWVNLRQEVPRWLPAGDGFLWASERDDLPRLELRGRDGKLRRVVVPAELGYQGLVSVDKEGAEIIINASANPTESRLYRVSIKDPFGEAEAITKTPGMHAAAFSADHRLSVVTSRTMDGMPTSRVFGKDGKLAGELPSVAENPQRKPTVELVQVGTKERKFHAAVVWPRDYDAKKKYPVIVDVYGGPHHIHVLATQTRWLLDQWYADQGFIVVAVDGRGTPGRGAEWERAIYQMFGSIPLDDQVAGLKALGVKFPAMDLKRVGIDGWSFGGYMSALAVMRRPNVFHAGVAGAPVCDWHDYDTHYTERYLGIPPKDAAAYKEGSILSYAADLKRPLMILHGTADDNVYFRHSLRMVDALFRAGKDFEMVPLSGLTHMVPDPLVMERLHGRIALFFQKHLGRPE